MPSASAVFRFQGFELQRERYRVSWALGWALISLALLSTVLGDLEAGVVEYSALVLGLASLCIVSPILICMRTPRAKGRWSLYLLPGVWLCAVLFLVAPLWPQEIEELGSVLLRAVVASALIGLVTAAALSQFLTHLSVLWRVLYSLLVSFLWALLGVVGILTTIFLWYLVIVVPGLLIGHWSWGIWLAPPVAGGVVGWVVSYLCVLVLDAPFALEDKPYLAQSGTGNAESRG